MTDVVAAAPAAPAAPKLPVYVVHLLFFEGPPGTGKSYQMRSGNEKPREFKQALCDLSPVLGVPLGLISHRQMIFSQEVPENWKSNQTIRGKTTPLFRLMCSDPVKYMCEFQCGVLEERFVEMQNAIDLLFAQRSEITDPTEKERGLIIAERSMFVDRLVFGQAGHDNGFFSDVQWSAYNTFYRVFVKTFEQRLADHALLSHNVTLKFDLLGTVYMKQEPAKCLERIRLRHRHGEEKLDMMYCEEMKQRHEFLFADQDYVGGPVFTIDESQLDLSKQARVIPDLYSLLPM